MAVKAPSHEGLEIIRNGEVVSYLNPQLIQKNKISKKAIENIKRLHNELMDVYDKMTNTPITEVETLRNLFKETTRIEFALQKEWKFWPNPNKHYWYKVPHCACSKLDNGMNQPKVINSNCIIHGDLNESK